MGCLRSEPERVMNQKWVGGSQSVELSLSLPSDSERTSFCAQASETTQCPEIPPPPTLATILSTQRRNNYTQAIRKDCLVVLSLIWVISSFCRTLSLSHSLTGVAFDYGLYAGYPFQIRSCVGI